MIRLQNIKKRLIIFEFAPETLHYQKPNHMTDTFFLGGPYMVSFQGA